jgi:murein L,D-transpeptidase YcbB/YkuD
MIRRFRKFWRLNCVWLQVSAALILASSSIAAGSDGREAPRQFAASSSTPDTTGVAGISVFRAQIADFYDARNHQPVWLDHGVLNADGRHLIKALLRSDEQGLSFADLAAAWRQGTDRRLSDAEALRYDQQLTELFLQYCWALRMGELTPQEAGITWAVAEPSFDAAQLLSALGTVPLPDLLREQQPPHAEYGKLLSALAFYREIQARGGWPRVPDGPVLESGQIEPRVAALRQRLAREGYAAIRGDGRDTLFDDELAQVVKQFQQAHGLTRDGRVGRATLAALNISAPERVEQIQVNMERWRWMPRELPSRRIEVNAAAAWLELIDDGQVRLSMKTIVGSPRHPTPVLFATVRSVIVNPVWNVPDSITRNEIVPRLRRDPGYLRAQDIRILGRSDDPYGLQIDWAHVSGMRLRLQQQPGPLNALGLLKFDMPNAFDVYLHDTPARSLFARDVRTLSHGCVRLQFPGRLAAYLLNDPEESFSARFGEAYPTRLDLDRPIAVYLTYWTAFVAANGEIQFRDDVYGLDAKMRGRLQARTEPAVLSSISPGGCPGPGRIPG